MGKVRIDINRFAIIDLASNTNDDLTGHLDKLSGSDISKALKVAAKKRKNEKITAASNDILDLFEHSLLRKQKLVNGIRRRRNIIAASLHALKAIDEAIGYGSETNNYIPLLILTEAVRPTSLIDDCIDIDKEMSTFNAWVLNHTKPTKQPNTP